MNKLRLAFIKPFYKLLLLVAGFFLCSPTSRAGECAVPPDSLPGSNAIFLLLDTMKHHLTSDKKYNASEERLIRENKKLLSAYLAAIPDSVLANGRGKDCLIYAEVDKYKQNLYLYIAGKLADSFLVSTGMHDMYETPEMSRHPEGPLDIKHTSKKFPGGNYKGMGNMPYSVFIANGYAIHGTTLGNILKLGIKASHGCIRLHPDHAKFFYALVSIAGLKNTWVTILDTTPAATSSQ